MRVLFSVTVGALLALPQASLSAQVQETKLTKAEASFPESFSTVRGLRELKDGRLLVSDGLGQALMVVDLARASVDTIGRVGGGPEEYQTPDGLHPLPGDSTLLVDLGNGRLTVLNPKLEFVHTYPIAQGSPGGSRGPGGPGGGPGSMTIRVPRGVDSQGRIYFQSMGGMRPGGQPADSVAVSRWDRKTDQTQQVAMMKLPETKVTRSGSGNNMNVSMQPVPLSPADGWAVAPDGRIGAVRSNPYRVEWISESGVVRGPEVSYTPIRIGRAEKEEWVAGIGSDGLAVMVSAQNGQMRTTFARGGAGRLGGGSAPNIDSYEWPDVMPAFNASRVYVDAAGHLWVTRYTRAGAEPTFDVFDGKGVLTKRVVLPKGRTIVGFGKGVVYTTTKDEFDLQWLEKYRI